jgi:hypothetical protein
MDRSSTLHLKSYLRGVEQRPDIQLAEVVDPTLVVYTERHDWHV